MRCAIGGGKVLPYQPLYNNDSTCYINGMLQCLIHNPYIRKWALNVVKYVQKMRLFDIIDLEKRKIITESMLYVFAYLCVYPTTKEDKEPLHIDHFLNILYSRGHLSYARARAGDSFDAYLAIVYTINDDVNNIERILGCYKPLIDMKYLKNIRDLFLLKWSIHAYNKNNELVFTSHDSSIQKQLHIQFESVQHSIDINVLGDRKETTEEGTPVTVKIHITTYPDIFMVCLARATPAFNEVHNEQFHVDEDIVLGEWCYTITGLSIALSGHEIAVVKNNGKWILYNDASCRDLSSNDMKQILALDRCGTSKIVAANVLYAKTRRK